MKAWQRAGLIFFIVSIAMVVMSFTEKLVTGTTEANPIILIVACVFGACLILIGD